MRRRQLLCVSAVAVLGVLQLACGAHKDAAASAGGGPETHIISGVTISETMVLSNPPLPMTAARNETASTVLQLANLPKPKERSVLTLRVQPLQLVSENAQIGVDRIRAYEILPMPVDANRAGYVRHTGLKASSRTMPRALLPVPMDGGRINVTALRDPSEPLKPNSRLGLSDQPVMLWFDVQVPATARAGAYTTSVDLMRDGQRVESVPLSLNVYDFNLPDERHLQMVGRLEWTSLETLYPDLFEAIRPQLMNRGDKKYEQAIRLIDQFEALAHEHRTTVVMPRLQPNVKWPANAPPTVSWDEFDSIVEPWLSGSGFADKIPAGYWPLPRVEFLENYPTPLQMQYWMAAASHFDQRGWMDRAWVEEEKETPGRASAIESVQLSTRVAEILGSHPRLRASLPLEDGQLQFRDAQNAAGVDRAATGRLMTSSPGMVFAAPPKNWPAGVVRPAHWLRTDLPGLVPYVGAGGDERDVRLWAWLAFLRQAQVIGWDGALPHSETPQEAADPNELTWFYPGRWFGVDEPVPTIQLKWLRRAQQDYEYLYLARQRGQGLYAQVMSRLMIKQVQTPPNETPDPTLGLLSGTTDQGAWTKALELLARNILLREPGKPLDEEREQLLNLETANWIAPQDKPLQVARATEWGWAARAGNWVDLRLGLDIYNASDQPLTGELQWVGAPKGWEFNPQPVGIGLANAVNVFQVKRFDMEARVDLDRLGPDTRKPVQLRFVDAMRNRPSYVSVLAPVAASDRREGKLSIDGNLGDWDDAADSIQQGPMTVMLDRPSLQRQALQPASTASSVYSNWADKSFYLAFKLDGLTPANTAVGRNQVDYQLHRAWGEDLCEILIQPVYARGGDVGQTVHVVCRPNGSITILAKPAPRNRPVQGGDFRPIAAGPNVRFQGSVDGAVWRGELAIPWDAINDQQHQGMHPTLLRFNFAQHKHGTGESSSWAGPVDFGKDDGFMGLLYLRDLRAPGMGGRE